VNLSHHHPSSPAAAHPSEPVSADVSGAVASSFAAARAAQANWSRTPVAARLKSVRRLRQFIAQRGVELAEAAGAARRRPGAETLAAEVLPLAEACRFLEQNAGRLLRPKRYGAAGRPLWLSGVHSEVRREPWGVVLIIGPGNYPLLLPGVQLIQALVAGNGVVVKPGIDGTAAMVQLRRLIGLAGFDPRLVNIVPESPEAARVALAARPDKVLFTGSAPVGERILFQLAPHLIPATMELSGCDAVVVRADADLDLVVKALTFGLRLNGGATCLAPKRVFVASARATELEGRLAEALKAEVTVQTVSDQIDNLVRDAITGGAHFIAGGRERQNALRLPAILGGVTPSAQILREDVFAPVVAVVTVADDHEAVLRVNHCPFALGVSIFSADESAARMLSGRLSAGVVTINDLILPTADARLPFGGRRQSGFGVTRGAEGLLELTTPQVVTVTRGKFRPSFDAPRAGDEEMFAAYLRAAHERSPWARVAAGWRLIRHLMRRNTNHQPK
jgi:acyl-CoA reductase-like NAD-dependent aldehyde dehydrogenase